MEGLGVRFHVRHRRGIAVWVAIRSCAEELIEESGSDLLSALHRMEESLDSRPYHERIRQSIPALRGPVIEIVEYRQPTRSGSGN